MPCSRQDVRNGSTGSLAAALAEIHAGSRRGSRGAALLALALLSLATSAQGQAAVPGAVGEDVIRQSTAAPAPAGPLRSVAAGPLHGARTESAEPPLASPRFLEAGAAAAAPSLGRHLLVGAGVGATLGTAFGLAVIGIADCGGPNCTEERVVGVAGNAAAGAVLGALVGGVVYLIR